MRELVLASSSPYRRELLQRLHLPFCSAAPEIDETAVRGESPQAMVRRLSLAKAQALGAAHPDALIIGSDQCAVLDARIIGKPGNHAAAVAQLRAASGRSMYVHTGLCLLDSASGAHQLDVVSYDVRFRTLDDAEIETYLALERPYDCAGSVKSEGLGASLLEHMRGDDPSALIGLPLIRLSTMLRAVGVAVPPPATLHTAVGTSS
ncbi:Maf family protein [Acidihalobacter ferrooxydans]|uniref:7-methyl-GTP pyrophosphatase n=1 Tax=Acidihalobacter ferrooxydans TaxID=1765967 RepID=A0A1P8UFN6_9GAMM|nr:Maf family nucleotide pyrophosphatase [Acidihalobacter ferrooxydans]APZ42663.1 septum formation inhibitor Maf [Acidihalobacter ferrooxydans]